MIRRGYLKRGPLQRAVLSGDDSGKENTEPSWFAVLAFALLPLCNWQ